jgi:hypothetical protein
MDQGKRFNFDLFYIAPLVEQIKQNFIPLNEELGRKNVELKAEQIYKKHGVKPFIFLDNISCLTSIQEKDGVEWLSFMSWLVKLRARGYSVVFLHHATKAGDTSSGSNMKERAVDVEMKLELPDPAEMIKDKDGAQFKVSFPKWREFANSAWATPFIACLDRNFGTWSIHEVMKKTKRDVKEALANGGIKEAMTVTGLSESQVYKYRKEIAKETRKLNDNDKFSHRKSGKLPSFTRKHNRQEAEKIEQDFAERNQITKENHIAELWRLKQEAREKGMAGIALRAEELRGKLMGYYVDKSMSLNVNKEESLEELEEKYKSLIKLWKPVLDEKKKKNKDN